MKRYLFGIALQLFGFATYSCECSDFDTTVEIELSRSDMVVSAKVIEILDLGQNSYQGQPIKSAGYKVKVEILTVFKGQENLKYLVVRGSETNCDYYFRMGMKYLIYGSTEKGELITDICTRTGKLQDNLDVLKLKNKNHTHHTNHQNRDSK